MRRWLIYGIIFFVLFIFASVIYVFFLGGDELLRPPDQDSDDQNTVTVPPGNDQTLYNVSGSQNMEKVVSTIFSLDDTAIWYFTQNGKLYRDTLDGGQLQNLSMPRQLSVAEIHWSLGSDFIVKHSTVEGFRFAYYNAASKQYLDLPSNVYSVGWISAIGKIVYVWRNADGSHDLKIGNPDTSDFSTLSKLSGPLQIIVSDSGNRVVLYQEYTGGPNKAFAYDTNSGVLRELIDRGQNTGFTIAPNGSKLIFSRLNEESGKDELWVYDFASEVFKNLMILTKAENIGWLKSTNDRFVYSISNQPDAEAGAVSESLHIYEYATGLSTNLYPALVAQPIDYKKMKISLDGKTAIFIDGNTSKLYRLRLP